MGMKYIPVSPFASFNYPPTHTHTNKHSPTTYTKITQSRQRNSIFSIIHPLYLLNEMIFFLMKFYDMIDQDSKRSSRKSAKQKMVMIGKIQKIIFDPKEKHDHHDSYCFTKKMMNQKKKSYFN